MLARPALRADLDDAMLEVRLFNRAAPVRDRVRPDCAHIHYELKRDDSHAAGSERLKR